ncbi:hypothetical protein [Hymenobacter rubidus]|uniref:hypothetical protein n=1 Tax=Hymenobacter rubidus TaxID=1441626 RepID=UPI00191E54E6|nr:hypothetical protein [Hymenobacter rubidus]
MRVTIYFIFLFCCILGIYALNRADSGITECAEYGLQKDAHYKGIVSKKWNDPSQHGYPMLRIVLDGELKGFTRDLNFRDDTGKFYKFIEVGDSVKKKQGELKVAIRRNSRAYIIHLQPACD